MIKISRTVLIFLLVPLFVHTQNVDLKVMTFNVRYDNPNDGAFGWALRKPLVIGVIREVNPDIIGFQEPLDNQVTELQEKLSDYFKVGVARDDGKRSGEYNPIFYKVDRFEKKSEGTFWLSETPNKAGSRSWNAACNRLVTWVKLKDQRSRKKLFVFNTHFDHVSEEARIQSAHLLLSAIQQVAGDEWVVVTGDFNDMEGSAMYRILTGSNIELTLINTARISRNPPAGPPYTYIGFPFKPQDGDVIDFIFTKNNRSVTVTGHSVITFHRDDQYPSDHLPVSTTFEIKLKKRNYGF